MNISQSSSAPAARVSIVLVHGAFVDASGWQPVHALLAARGHEVLVVQHPSITLGGDVAATTRAIDAARYPVLLVGHSYGGVIITEAGEHPKVSSLVYLAAFVPDVGESVAVLSAHPAAPGEATAPVLPPQDGYLTVDPVQFHQAFGADVAPALTSFMAAAQVPWGLAAFSAAVSRAAWKSRPSHYLVATGDHMLPPSAQRGMAARARARSSEIASSHAVMLARPQEVADFIDAASTLGAER